MDKSLIQVKEQMQRIHISMLDSKFNLKDRKRYKKWCNIADAIDHNLLAYFGVKHLWENPVHEKRNEPLPYDVRVTH